MLSRWSYQTTYLPLLRMGRTARHQPYVDAWQWAELEHDWPDVTLSAGYSPSQRLDVYATEIIGRALSSIQTHHGKRDVLTAWKARDRLSHEMLFSDMTAFDAIHLHDQGQGFWWAEIPIYKHPWRAK